MTNQNHRYHTVDCLRAVAVLLVIWMHASAFFALLPTGAGSTARPYETARLIDFGRIGVALFFAISGFVVLTSLNQPSNNGLRSFAIRRFFRLYPVYWLSIPIALIPIWLAGQSAPSWSTIIANFTIIQGYLGFESLQGVYWTLQIEFVFYCLCATLFYFKLSRSEIAIALCICGMIAVFLISRVALLLLQIDAKTHLHTLGMTALHLAIMFWGALFRIRFDDNLKTQFSRFIFNGFVATMIALGCFTIAAALVGKLSIDSDYFRLGIAYPTAVISFIVCMRLFKFKSRFGAFIGKISYSLYLFHSTSIVVVYWASQQLGIAVNGSIFMLILCIGLSIAVSIAASSVAYHYVERRSINLGLVLSTKKILATSLR